MDDVGNRETWVLLGQALADHAIASGGDRRVRAGVWAQRMGAERVDLAAGRTAVGSDEHAAFVADAVAAVRAGLGVADLFGLGSAARLRLGQYGRPNGTALSVQSAASRVLSFLSLGALVGWLTVEGSFTGGDRFERVHAWAQAGLGEDGWLYAAAGFSPAEAQVGLADGSLDAGRARVLAVLRGAVLPAG